MTDLELARAAAGGSEVACTLFVNRYRRLCYRVVRPFADSDDDALDLCQDVFVRALDRIGQYRGTGSLASWIGQLALNIGRRRAEQRRGRREVLWSDADVVEAERDPSLAPETVDPQTRLEHAQRVDALRRAMAQLSRAEQLTLTLFYLEELSLVEIAEVTGLPAGTIKSHLSRGRQRLRALLD